MQHINELDPLQHQIYIIRSGVLHMMYDDRETFAWDFFQLDEVLHEKLADVILDLCSSNLYRWAHTTHEHRDTIDEDTGELIDIVHHKIIIYKVIL